LPQIKTFEHRQHGVYGLRVNKPPLPARLLLCLLITLALAAMLLASCGQPTPAETPTPTAPTPSTEPTQALTEEEEATLPEEEVITTPTQPITPTLPVDIPTPTPIEATPPSAITGLVAVDAYDGIVNLSWGKSTAEDFSHYNVYVNKAEILDAKGMTPSQKITVISTNTCQVTGLEVGTKYYFALTATDKSGNENKRVTCVTATPTPMTRGTVDPDLQVDIYQSDKAWPGTTLFSDNHILSRPRIIEVNMRGEIVWQYLVPENLRQNIHPQAGMNPGFAVELLPNNNILFVSPQKGVYEINRGGDVVWSYEIRKISHDVDRLPNGNTIFVFGGEDQKDDAQVTEVNPKGEIVWQWYAKDYFDKPPYNSIYDEGWTHTNAVTRLPNGNTLISPRNFNFVVEVNPKGEVVRTLGEGLLDYQHGPELLPNGNLLSGSHRRPPELAASISSYAAVEIDLKTGKIVWKFMWPPGLPQGVRDANRLPNGNTLVVEPRIAEVTTEGEIVWQLRLKEAIETEILSTKQGIQGRSFYKADRISIQR